MKCIKCGAELAEDSKFCNVCGEPAPQGGAAPTLVVENIAETPAPVEPVTEATVVAPEPVTEAPVLAPVTPEPVTEALAPVEPVTEAAPAAPEPVTEAPTAAPAPVEPVTEAPTSAPAPAPVAAPAAPQAPVQAAPKKSSAGIIIVIILLIAIAAGAGIFIGKNLLKDDNGKDEDKPGVETVSTKTKVTFGDMEYEIPDDYEYYYDTLSQGIDCLVVDMESDLELIIYDTGYSYYAFENVFDQIIAESYPEAITTLKKESKYVLVNYKSEAEGNTYYFYDGAVNINSSHAAGVIIIRMNDNLKDADLTKALNITDTAKKARGFDRSTGETDKFAFGKQQTVITSYANEEGIISTVEETPTE